MFTIHLLLLINNMSFVRMGQAGLNLSWGSKPRSARDCAPEAGLVMYHFYLSYFHLCILFY